ncbi:MAG: hypothetical protein K8963_02650, partial [Proteobacteria bacterium]|nr:hypothetical protein [Pseudomonadota bacterium]
MSASHLDRQHVIPVRPASLSPLSPPLPPLPPSCKPSPPTQTDARVRTPRPPLLCPPAASSQQPAASPPSPSVQPDCRRCH